MNPNAQKLGVHTGLPVTSKPVPERREQRRFPDTGSEIISISPHIAFGTSTFEGRVDVVGYGLEILEGVGGLTVQAGGILPQTSTVSVTMLAKGENETGELRVGRAFQKGEVYDGAILPGRFEQLRVRWTSASAAQPTTSLKVRVFKQPLRAAVVAPPKPQGLPILDYFDGLVFTQAGTDSGTVLYDDSVTTPQPLLYRDANPAIGTGIGGDFQMGPHFSLKRKLIGRVIFPASVGTAFYRVGIEAHDSAGNWQPWAFYVGVDRSDDIISTWDSIADKQIVTFGIAGTSADSQSDGGPQGSGLWVPAKIRIRAVTNTVAQGPLSDCSIWLAFVGA